MSAWHLPIVFIAAVAAGMINSVAGGGTLVTFPTLVWLGRDPILANATNTVALWPGSAAGMVGFFPHLRGGGKWLVMLTGPSIVGGIIGAVLLLKTPTETFSFLVPYLILGATVLLALQEPLQRTLLYRSKPHDSKLWWTGAILFQFLVAVYGGYFGAGIGILMLAALGLLRLTDIYQMNGLKNFFALCINGVAALYFAWSGSVHWLDAAVMAVGAVAGGYGGATLAQKMGRKAVRLIAVAVGFAMAISLLIGR